MKENVLDGLCKDIMKAGMFKLPFRLPAEDKYKVQSIMCASDRRLSKIDGGDWKFRVITGKKINITDADWKFLVILDTCRYDVFKKVYGGFFDKGVLKKALSPACWTREWLIKSFPDKYDDIIFISGNANANSKMVMEDSGFKFSAKDKFFKVVDVWDFGWDDSVGQVPPDEINKAFKKWYIKYPGKRFILHYMQPHQPWINIGGEPKTKEDQKNDIDMANDGKSQISKVREFLRKVPEEYWWQLRKILRIKPEAIIEKYYQKNGREGMIKGYTKELILGLEYVSKLIEETNGKWLITADHGELLGEGGWYGHPRNHRVRKQVEVPWFEIES